jgi:hypothetical protein
MLVRELIERLQQFDGELEIVAHYNGDEYESDLEFLRLRQEDGVVHFCD